MKQSVLLKATIVFLVILFLSHGQLFAREPLVVPVDGEQLYNVIMTAQKKDSDSEKLLINALSKIHIKDYIRITMVNSKGQTGATAQPDIEFNDNNAKLTIGAILDFDLEKYKKGVMAPLRDVLKQVSTNGGERIQPSVFLYKEGEFHSSEGGVVSNETFKFGNVPYKTIGSNNNRWLSISDSYKLAHYQVVLNILPNASNIFKSIYEGYTIDLSPNMMKSFLVKWVESNCFTVHFVFKDEANQEIFHEICFGVKPPEKHEINNPHRIEHYACERHEYAMFMPGSPSRGGDFSLVISPEILEGHWWRGRNKTTVVCQVEADASEIQKIKSYEVYIEEAEIK